MSMVVDCGCYGFPFRFQNLLKASAWLSMSGLSGTILWNLLSIIDQAHDGSINNSRFDTNMADRYCHDMRML